MFKFPRWLDWHELYDGPRTSSSEVTLEIKMITYLSNLIKLILTKSVKDLWRVDRIIGAFVKLKINLV